MKRLVYWLFVAVVLMFCRTTPVQAAASNRVLLVYDSENLKENGEQTIDSLSRTLASLNITVTEEKFSTYRAGELARGHFRGVITLVNWHQSRLTNPRFEKDRAAFTGKKLHIGQNLTAAEMQALGTAVTLTHQQYTLVDPAQNSQQLIPFTSDQWPMFSVDKNSVGELVQQSTGKRYAFGTINGNQAYLPAYRDAGLMGLLGTRLLAQFFIGQVTAQPPVLVLTGITPVSDLKLLKQTTRYLHAQGVPYALSATMTAANPQLPEHAAYLRTLAQAQVAGAFIFLQVPEVYDPSAQTATTLQQQLNAQLAAAAQQGVFPGAISAPGYWMFDQLFSQSLHQADQNLLLANPTNYALNRYAPTNGYTPSLRTLIATPWTNFNAVSGNRQLTFATPTAWTINLPTSKKTLQAFRQQVRQWTDQSWWSLSADPAVMTVRASQAITVSAGQYTVAGRAVNVGEHAQVKKTAAKAPQTASQVNAFTRFQGNILLIFIIVALVILTIFLLYGRHIYRNQFRRKGRKP